MRARQILGQYRSLGDGPAWLRHGLPNAVTVLALFVGLTGLTFAAGDNIEAAIFCTLFAALLDACDGRVARAAGTASRFGAELDSLADFVDFGVAPAFLLFTWGLSAPKSLGWIAVMIFALAAALRLARFNVASEEVKPKWQSDFFTGMPTPAAAIVVLLPVYLDQIGIDGLRSGPGFNLVLAYVLLIAFMMVSTIPTYSGKLIGERVSRDMVLPILGLAALAAVVLVSYPWELLTAAAVAYLALIPFAIRSHRRHRAADRAARPAASP